MQNISSFLLKFQTFGLKEQKIKENLIIVVKEFFDFDLDSNKIKIIEDNIFLDLLPMEKIGLNQKRVEIEEKLRNLSNNPKLTLKI